ncbi:MAG: hypothetical protein A2V65_10980 [Deltaproteobacteria bacterium RBG_13_49_15]|nr:MAG: hypothetical protein A2V65_10980 [Deltaproteobacteria bacterium RBG_13_49_15]
MRPFPEKKRMVLEKIPMHFVVRVTEDPSYRQIFCRFMNPIVKIQINTLANSFEPVWQIRSIQIT